MVGFWPLDSQYGGADLSGNNNHMILHEMIQHHNGVEILPSTGSFGEIQPSPSLHLKRKLSWFCSVTLVNLTDGPLFEFNDGDLDYDLQIWVYHSKFYLKVAYEGNCQPYGKHFNYLAVGRLYKFAVSVDVTNSEASIGIDEEESTIPLPQCDEDLKTSGAVYVGVR